MIVTVKQANFIEDICKVLSIPNPEISRKDEAQSWISHHIDEYNEVRYGRDYDGGWDMDPCGCYEPMY